MSLKANRIKRYYDSHYRDDEELTQTIFHQMAIEYLMLVMRWLFQGQAIGFTTNVNFYVTADPNEEGVSPDIAAVEGLQDHDRPADEAGSYFVGGDGPAPRIVFEMSSDHSWRLDLGIDDKQPPHKQKPTRYASMGVQEYFAFDPNQRKLWTKEWKGENRLVGWRLNSEMGQYERIGKDEQGRLWSEQLESWLVVNENYLRLYTREGELRLTEAQAEKQRADEEERRATTEQRRADILETQVRAKQRQADLEKQKADEEARLRAELLEKLRSKGIDPETL